MPNDREEEQQPPMLNAHIRMRDSVAFIAGQPLPYLNALRDGITRRTVDATDKHPWPVGKLQFAAFAARHGVRVPSTLAVIRNGVVAEGRFALSQEVRGFLRTLPDGSYFCKPEIGGHGDGALRLDLSPSAATMGGKAASISSVVRDLSSQTYLVQHSLVPDQHPALARFNPGAINTLRLVTFLTADGAKPVAASVRIAPGVSIVDNWGAGGVAVPVALEDGTLGTTGALRTDFRLVDRNPVTGEGFGGCVPHFHEAVAEACKLHARLSVPSLGWDIAFLTDGPCLLECNRYWGLLVSLQLNPGFAESFFAFHLPHAIDSVARLDLSGSFANRSLVRMWLSMIAGASLANGRVEQITDDRMVVTVAGRKVMIDSLLRQMRNPRAPIRLSGINLSATTDTPSLGLDLEATFSGPA